MYSLMRVASQSRSFIRHFLCELKPQAIATPRSETASLIGDNSGRMRLMGHSRRFNALRAKYRVQWDAHQVIADHNARLLQAGKQPSNEHLINEQRAAEAVVLVRDELLAATSGVDQ
jgi:hypothetical protein